MILLLWSAVQQALHFHCLSEISYEVVQKPLDLLSSLEVRECSRVGYGWDRETLFLFLRAGIIGTIAHEGESEREREEHENLYPRVTMVTSGYFYFLPGFWPCGAVHRYELRMCLWSTWFHQWKPTFWAQHSPERVPVGKTNPNKKLGLSGAEEIPLQGHKRPAAF